MSKSLVPASLPARAGDRDGGSSPELRYSKRASATLCLSLGSIRGLLHWILSAGDSKELLRRLLVVNHARADAEKSTAKPVKPRRGKRSSPPKDISIEMCRKMLRMRNDDDVFHLA